MAMENENLKQLLKMKETGIYVHVHTVLEKQFIACVVQL